LLTCARPSAKPVPSPDLWTIHHDQVSRPDHRPGLHLFYDQVWLGLSVSSGEYRDADVARDIRVPCVPRRRYPLNEKRMAEIRVALEARRGKVEEQKNP
jgi:hypothetical protein